MEFIVKNGRSYDTKTEYRLRYDIFKNNLAKIDEFNSRKNNTSRVHINLFADRTLDEMQRIKGKINIDKHHSLTVGAKSEI